MGVDKKGLLYDLDKLNNKEFSYAKDQQAYHEFIDTLDGKFDLFLRENPAEKDVYLIQAIFNMIDFHDENKAMQICSSCWEYCKDVRALVFHCFLLEEYRGGVNDDLFNELEKARSEDSKINSCVQMYMGLFFREKNEDLSLIHLKNSVETYKNNVHAYTELGRFYSSKGDSKNAGHYFGQALQHVLEVRTMDEILNRVTDYYSINRYFDEMIFWSYCTEHKYNYLKDDSTFI